MHVVSPEGTGLHAAPGRTRSSRSGPPWQPTNPQTNARWMPATLILKELDRLEKPFDESADPVHVTGSAVVVGARGTILHLHKRLERWMQTGGHLEPGEMPYDAALCANLKKKTGLSLAHPASGHRLVHVDVHPAADGHTHLDLRYLLLGPALEPAPPPGESPHARWFSWSEADRARRTQRLPARCAPHSASPRPHP